jgi:hypothetical protein
MDARHGMPGCRLDKKAHRHLAMQLNTEAPEYPARQGAVNFASLSHGNKPSTRVHVPAPHNPKPSDPAEEQEYDNNQKDQPQSPGRIIAPASAMRPPRQYTKESQE